MTTTDAKYAALRAQIDHRTADRVAAVGAERIAIFDALRHLLTPIIRNHPELPKIDKLVIRIADNEHPDGIENLHGGIGPLLAEIRENKEICALIEHLGYLNNGEDMPRITVYLAANPAYDLATDMDAAPLLLSLAARDTAQANFDRRAAGYPDSFIAMVRAHHAATRRSPAGR